MCPRNPPLITNSILEMSVVHPFREKLLQYGVWHCWLLMDSVNHKRAQARVTGLSLGLVVKGDEMFIAICVTEIPKQSSVVCCARDPRIS